MRETLKYTFTVEGETEQWYLLWLRDQINACPDRDKNISIVPKVQQSPAKFYKSTSRKVTPVVTHICDAVKVGSQVGWLSGEYGKITTT